VGVLVVGAVAGAVLAGLGLPLGQGAQAAPAHPAGSALPGTALPGTVTSPSIPADPSPSPSPGPALPPAGTLHNASSRCLDLEKPDNGGWATTTGCDGSDRQRWQLHRAAGTDQYTIVNLAGDGCLDVENASRDDNARIVTWTCHDADNQRWLARGEGDTFTLANVYSGMCATAGDDGKLRQHACRADNGQRWTAEVPLPPDQSPSSSSAT
jgi:hypothetical protein